MYFLSWLRELFRRNGRSESAPDRCEGRLRAIGMLTFWVMAAPLAAIIGFPWTFIKGDIRLLYRIFMFGARAGVRLAGVRVQPVWLEPLDSSGTYIFMSNHASHLDPPILVPLIPRRTSVMVKKELFRIPILGHAMRLASLVPVDRGDRLAGIAAVRRAKQVVCRASQFVKQNVNMTIFVEGKRSYDGKLLPFKKGSFYLAMECKVPVVPVTIAGTHKLWPKGRLAVNPGVATVTFHPPIQPEAFGSRENLMDKVRTAIENAL
jgi:1-acyl-sn-glycerol-3-phosphate acyltransferase